MPPDPETLRAIARMTGGEFTDARSADTAKRTYQNLGSRLGRESGESEITWLFLAIAGVLLLVATAVGPSSRRVSPRTQTTTIVKGRSARSSRPAGWMTTEKTPFGTGLNSRIGIVGRARDRASSRDSDEAHLEGARLDATRLDGPAVQLNLRPKRLPADVKLSGKFAMPWLRYR